ncbi:hypothetical protein [Actinacidiphila glaucinigra]|uniref:hypothetical protein n=1 Tax=Actinacidiphila glaucinigra TaxID=235986 RepID=UPI00117EDE43|nr:hypothetical protein [Actinacidiphila glaucinigra]
MGNTRAWPVLRTTNLGEALSLAERLLSVASWRDPTSFLHASASSDDDLLRLTAALPGAEIESRGKGGVGLPVSFLGYARTFAEAGEALRTWADVTQCYLLWSDMKWPAVPELGLGEEYKYAELEIACHGSDIHCFDWAAEHTVFVHSRPGDDDRAAWLAAQVGAGVVGPPEFGW